MKRPPVGRFLWRLLAVLMLGLAALGVVLPVLPTVPFLLVAAWAAGRGWPALEARLLAHPRYGPQIRDWRARGAVPRAAKRFALLMMGLSLVVLAVADVPGWLRVLGPAIMAGAAIWLWRRPEA